jgi:hypothetical protein
MILIHKKKILIATEEWVFRYKLKRKFLMKVYQLFYIPLEMDLKHFNTFICKRIKYYRSTTTASRVVPLTTGPCPGNITKHQSLPHLPT